MTSRPSASSILQRAGVNTSAGLSNYITGRLGDAQRKEARARRDIATFQAQPNNPNSQFIIAELQRQLETVQSIRAEVRQVQQAWQEEQDFRTRSGRDPDTGAPVSEVADRAANQAQSRTVQPVRQTAGTQITTRQQAIDAANRFAAEEDGAIETGGGFNNLTSFDDDTAPGNTGAGIGLSNNAVPATSTLDFNTTDNAPINIQPTGARVTQPETAASNLTGAALTSEQQRKVQAVLNQAREGNWTRQQISAALAADVFGFATGPRTADEFNRLNSVISQAEAGNLLPHLEGTPDTRPTPSTSFAEDEAGAFDAANPLQAAVRTGADAAEARIDAGSEGAGGDLTTTAAPVPVQLAGAPTVAENINQGFEGSPLDPSEFSLATLFARQVPNFGEIGGAGQAGLRSRFNRFSPSIELEQALSTNPQTGEFDTRADIIGRFFNPQAAGVDPSVSRGTDLGNRLRSALERANAPANAANPFAAQEQADVFNSQFRSDSPDPFTQASGAFQAGLQPRLANTNPRTRAALQQILTNRFRGQLSSGDFNTPTDVLSFLGSQGVF